MRIEVVYALPERQHRVTLTLPAGARVAAALEAAAGHPPFDGLDLAAAPVGVYGDRVDRNRVLEDGDRLEIYRPLNVDPREARRRRAAAERHGRLSSRRG